MTAIIMKTMNERCFSAHSERLGPLTTSAPSRRTFWPGCSAWTPAVTTISPPSSPPEIATVAGSKRRTSTGCSDTVRFAGSTTQTAGWRSISVSALAGMSMPCADVDVHPPGDGRAEPHRARRIGEPTLTSKVRVTGSACGATSRTRPFAVTDGSSVRMTLISGRRRRPDHLRRHVEHGVAPVLAGDLEDHLPGLNDFARFGAARGDGAGDVGLELGVADPVLGDFELRLGVVHAGLGGVEGLLAPGRTAPWW